MPLIKSGSFNRHVSLSPVEEKAKVEEVRTYLGSLALENSEYCSDACLARYLKANNWNPKKAKKMIMETLKWRELYRPDQIRFEEVAKEAETKKIYRASFRDNAGRTVLVMRPGVQNTNELNGQIRYLVFCMENAIASLPPDQEQMVWLVDFEGWSMSTIPIKTTRETALVLQNHYPERLAYAILYNPPKLFELFWNVIRPFLDPATQKKVRFVYTRDEESQKVMESLFDMEKLEYAFGGRRSSRCAMSECVSTTIKAEEENIVEEAGTIVVNMQKISLNGDSLSTVVTSEPCLSG